MATPEVFIVQTVETELGWMAIAGMGDVLWRLSFGHASEPAAIAALGLEPAEMELGDWNPELARRLGRYAAGAADDFRDVAVASAAKTEFQHRIVAECRRIAYGETLSYQELAARAGRPRAARAVGNCMASNTIPLVIPCHRVVGAGGSLGGYSAPSGLSMKRRLLALEGAASSEPKRELAGVC